MHFDFYKLIRSSEKDFQAILIRISYHCYLKLFKYAKTR
ncbi:hypothetical protein MCC93_10540 [Morococcus cerebrosus]|uniref:Uncharacterized protein n=1 Tax=Morococcus cerebrosus TaxID=1056807 RepID=A0A0C1H406_9NEIS|nr:hypothetical protein MCC93_10540 [Morococcus cerebrosus]